MIYFKTKIITDPIKKLVLKVNRITHGHLNERADIIGNNEIATLSKQFNLMIEELESYYNELEEKVKQRTKEIQQQKEEISAQRDAIEDQRNMLADKNQNLEDAYREIQAQKNHITDSIVYAKRIQNAILPTFERINSLVPNNFILYKPKDIVSGDFYWVAELDGKAVIAAVDCTGHGVPGAFMSIIGSNMLNAAIKTHKASNASEILDFLNFGVAHALRQEGVGKSGVKDGMDIALVVIDYKNMELDYAGAYNPLYIARQDDVEVIKADKFAIGSYYESPERKYTGHKIEMKENETYYIFSDGYADQFGGEKGRKYMYKRFREYLLSISSNPLEEQRLLLDKEHINWMGKETQVDDIVIIGIKP
jgi:serine phosphatase RsbU (regulator of sigma subunit)